MIGLNETTAKHLACFCLLFLSLISLAAAQPTLRVSAQDHDGYSRVIVTFPSALPFSLEKDGTLLLVRVSSSSSFRLKAEPVKSRFIKSFSWAKSNDLYIIIIEARHERFRPDSFEIEKKRQLVIDFYELAELPPGGTDKAETPQAPAEPEKKEEPPPAAGEAMPRVEESAAAAKGIRTIVIDPGHGGLEVGARGKFGTLEKDITLAISLRLKTLIEKKRQLVIDFYELAELPPGGTDKAETPQAPAEPEKKEEPPPAAGEAMPRVEESAAAARGIRTIVIDPGHGGLEVGARGKFGTLEKDITLAISLRLKTLIEKSLAFNVELTRDRDMDVSLENRAAIANNHRAELFISIHANSSYRRNANGSETFFLSLNATDEEARRLAYLENNSTDLDKPLAPENEDDIVMILWDLAQAAYLKQSQRLAEIIQDELNSLLNTRDRGIKQAPFKVLTGVACPAVLVESAFISNPEEERELVREDFQENVAQAIYRGLVRYIKLLS